MHLYVLLLLIRLKHSSIITLHGRKVKGLLYSRFENGSFLLRFQKSKRANSLTAVLFLWHSTEQQVNIRKPYEKSWEETFGVRDGEEGVGHG